ncbi:F0F1 ATP synthase subunit B [Marinilabilia salmonicolor]|uniref:F0F1 ATP synthase subunit B n=1 Tax=Marinilabilia salmonicolor TaxID=989 RepID=UPI00029A5AB8|nr:F0F1 ATP synthase subunit B [Marinilabilia salmonicolor]
MELLTPSPGLIFWTSLTFIILLVILRKYAWPSILRALKVREETIYFALEDAKKAKEEAEQMEHQRKKVIDEARKERDMILKEARQMKNEIMEEARNEAREEVRRMLEKARRDIEMQRKDAMLEIRETIGNLSVEIAEKILKEELSGEEKHKKVINAYLNEMNFN